MMKTLKVALLVVFAAAAGCDEKKEEAKPAAPAPTAPAPAAPAPAAPAAPAPAGDAKAAPAGDAKAAPAGDAKADPGAAMKALGDAMKAAADAPKGATPCETAYNGIEAMAKAMEKSMPAGGAKKGPPPKDQFIAACKELPEDVQKCMDMNYAMANMAACQEAQKKADPAKMAKAREMMKGGK